MRANLDKSLRFVFDHEGGYVNNPNDPGGETKYGISKRSYPNLDIKNLTESQAKDIYVRDYWMPMGCDDIASPLDICVFDSSVNHGKIRAKSFLHQCNNDVDRFLNIRMRFYLRIVKQREFLRDFLYGWMRRVADLAEVCDNERGTFVKW